MRYIAIPWDINYCQIYYLLNRCSFQTFHNRTRLRFVLSRLRKERKLATDPTRSNAENKCNTKWAKTRRPIKMEKLNDAEWSNHYLQFDSAPQRPIPTHTLAASHSVRRVHCRRRASLLRWVLRSIFLNQYVDTDCFGFVFQFSFEWARRLALQLPAVPGCCYHHRIPPRSDVFWCDDGIMAVSSTRKWNLARKEKRRENNNNSEIKWMRYAQNHYGSYRLKSKWTVDARVGNAISLLNCCVRVIRKNSFSIFYSICLNRFSPIFWTERDAIGLWGDNKQLDNKNELIVSIRTQKKAEKLMDADFIRNCNTSAAVVRSSSSGN